MNTVFLAEVGEDDDEDHLVLTGLFDGAFHRGQEIAEQIYGLAFDDALTWARTRADLVYVDTEDGRYSAGAEVARNVPALPADLASRIRIGRRRPTVDWWLDRNENDLPMRFEVKVDLSPDEVSEKRIPEQRQLVQRIAELMQETGYQDVRCSSRRLEAGLADMRREWEASGRPEQLGWVGAVDFEIVGEIDAPEHRSVAAGLNELIRTEIAAVTGRNPYGPGAFDLEGRWGVTIAVHPPGYESPPSPF